MAKATQEAPSKWGGRMIPPKYHGIALGGFMGSGKSTVGQRLAQKMDVRFVDMDEELTRLFGSISQQFTRDGEDVFRSREREWIASFRPEAVVVLGFYSSNRRGK